MAVIRSSSDVRCKTASLTELAMGACFIRVDNRTLSVINVPDLSTEKLGHLKMVVVKVSRTAAINPPGVSPVLTVAQLWKGMVIKAREPQKFVALMEGCEILREDDQGLTRVITFKEGWGPPGGKAEEEVRYYEPMRLDFSIAATGEKVSNIVSTDCNDESVLYMTFTIEWPHPDIEDGSPEALQKRQQCSDLASEIIQKTNETIRDMVRDGRVV